MILYTKKEDCCGCTACASACPHEAIIMTPDDLGFLYPQIDSEKCTECGLCRKVCAFNAQYSKKDNLETPLVYAARHKNIEEVETSRSGAVFIALSDWIIGSGGVVYGVGYVDHFRVVHKRAETKEARDEFKGSKYVQSDLNTVFPQIKTDLKAGLKVLFSGTPCQTSGLKSFLSNSDTSNLFICDIICHGVPSPYFWRDYLAYIEKKEKVISVNFRDKSELGWAAHNESFTFDNHKTYTHIYTYIFYQHIMLRSSCSVCCFTNFQRPSDITIADFWGWEKVDKSFNDDDKGVSLVLINTPKGKDWFGVVKDNLNYIESNTIDCLQPNLQYPTQLHKCSSDFEKYYKKYGFRFVLMRFGNVGVFYTLRRCVEIIKKLLIKMFCSFNKPSRSFVSTRKNFSNSALF
jgi:coenzyme F420-reducing hydrogenase beta subunit